MSVCKEMPAHASKCERLRANTSVCKQVIFTSVDQSLSYSDGNLPSLSVPLLLYCRLMKLRELREVNRDVFAVQMGGFDQHFSMKSGLTSLFSEINGALVGFRTALKAENLDDGSTLWDHVTVVMESEFGRTITPNASGGTGTCYRLEYVEKFVVKLFVRTIIKNRVVSKVFLFN